VIRLLKKLLLLFFIFSMMILPQACDNKGKGSSNVDTGPDDEVAVLDTDYGRMVFEFYPKEAPNHVANFKKLTKDHFFDGTAFHRIDLGSGVIQGGDPNTKTHPDNPATWGQGEPNQPKIKAEFNEHNNVRGAVGAARSQDVDSASSQFFVNIKDNPGFDQTGNQYTVFAHVIEGMNVVDIIANAPSETAAAFPRPLQRINICKAYLVKKDQLKSLADYTTSCKP
jgi:peptidyl-prolyl cis-trans isomerase B (cyclophilin B)